MAQCKSAVGEFVVCTMNITVQLISQFDHH